MNKKVNLIIILLLIILSLTVGCTYTSEKINGDSNGVNYPVQIQDKYGRNITIEEKPETLISLAPSNSETILSLGLQDHLIGVSNLNPPELENKTKIGDFNSVNLEKIIELDPDVVLGVPGVQKEKIEKLEEVNVKVVTLGARDIEGIYENIEMIGKIMNETDRANKEIEDMKDSVEKVKNQLEGVKKKKAFFILWYPTMTAGEQSFIHDVLQESGLINIAGEVNAAFPDISEEKIIKKDPEVIIYTKHSNTTFEKIKNRSEWQTITAVQEENIYGVEDSLINQPSPRVVKAIKELASDAYPKTFQD